MGGCASRPKDLDTETAPAPVEVPAVATEEPVAAAVEAKPESATQVRYCQCISLQNFYCHAFQFDDIMQIKLQSDYNNDIIFFYGLFQEKTDEVEATAPLVDLSEPAEVAPKTEETKEEVVPVETESKPTESEAKVVVEANEEKKEVVA